MKKLKFRLAAALLAAAVAVTVTSGCSQREADPALWQAQNREPENGLDQSEEIRLTICGPWTACRAMENAAAAFNEKYPNCEVEYEYLQNFDESIKNRLSNAPESVDLFLTSNIQMDSPLYPYAMELLSEGRVDLSDTNDALIRNFTLLGTPDQPEAKLYSIPLGGELRGLYVNTTLLASLGLQVPENREELLEACRVIKEKGMIPFHGNPGLFAQRLLYPYVCSLVANSANYEETYSRVNSCEPGVSELFREPMELMYTLMENGYYNYKYVETELNMFTDTSNEGSARYFFNIFGSDGSYEKEEGLGQVAFMPGTLTQQETMERIRQDYHSTIEYEFILAPVDGEGGFAYLSPGHGIAVNQNASHPDWALEFLNFLFGAEENQKFAKDINYIPNTKDSFAAVRSMFDVSDERISDLGQVTFDYPFYNVINDSLIDISKGNNPKYMDVGSNGQPVLYGFDHYMNELEASFAEYREGGAN